VRPPLMLRPLALSALLLAASLASAQPPAAPAAKGSGKWTQRVAAGKDVWATLQTSEGDIVVRLFSKAAPQTVASFVGVASGEKEWRHPVTGAVSRTPLYEGVIFHRVIPGFMIQGGDPAGTGSGNPGFNVPDEFNNGYAYDRPGLLGMANVGQPNTNGSQFFITVAPAAHLTNRHTIFGEVVSGYETVVKISEVPTARGNRPVTPVTLQKVILSETLPKAKAPGAAKKASKAKTAVPKGAAASPKP
jgi:peptidyl-prolyl cis-trans isomerase A (cyclophilin A)